MSQSRCTEIFWHSTVHEAIYESLHFLVMTVKMQRNSSKGRGEQRKERRRRRKVMLSFLLRFMNLFLKVGAHCLYWTKNFSSPVMKWNLKISLTFEKVSSLNIFRNLHHHISMLPPVIENVESFSIQLFIAKGYIYKVHCLWPHRHYKHWTEASMPIACKFEASK